MIKDLKDFLLRGNVVDLAVAVIIGVAFAAVITSFTDDILMQIIAAIGGQPDFSSLTINIGDGVIRYGSFLNAVISFLIIGAVLFFVVKAYEKIVPKKDAAAKEVDLLTEIRDLLKAQNDNRPT
jgi:large conductance mechanosensitive channel